MLNNAKIARMGTKMAEELGKNLVETVSEENRSEFLESMGFKEDNNMANSGDMYTTVLAKTIWYKSYDSFKQYYDATIQLTPADVGMPEGAGAYKLPKVYGATAAKLVDGQVVQYVNDNKDSVTLDTDTYGIGTRIDRRIRLRAAKGFVQRLMQSASDAVQRAVATDIANGMVSGAASGNTVSSGVSYDSIEDAKANIKLAKTTDNVLFGFYPKVLALSTVGMQILAKTTEFKNIFYRTQGDGRDVNNDYIVWQGLKVMDFQLITVQKGAKDVHAIVCDNDNFFYFLMETGMDTYEGRLPGTAGSEEIILALDAGMVAANTEAASVITAA